MKKNIYSFILIFAACLVHASAQTPHAIPYQAVARDNSGNAIAGQNISLRLSVHDAAPAGTVVYRETHAATTNALGLFTINIGQGTPALGTFPAIDWGSGTKFIQVEMDPAGGSAYIDMGTQQMLSVPYALYAEKANVPGVAGPPGPQGPAGFLSNGSAAGNTPFWDGTNWILNSGNVYNNGGNVGIGTTSPSNKLTVAGNADITGNVGIGTSSPTAKLDVAGNIKIADGTQGAGKVLKSDANGLSSWSALTGTDLLSNPLSTTPPVCTPVLVGSDTTQNAPVSIAVSGNYAYVVNNASNSMQVINITNPSAPVVVGTIGTGTFTNSVAVSGNFAYVVNAGTSNNMQVINISNPLAPVMVNTVSVGSNPTSVTISGNYAFVTNGGDDNLQIYNITNPLAITLSGSVSTSSTPYYVTVSGNYAYVANLFGSNMQVINITNPSLPSVVGAVTTGSFPRSVAVSGNYAYVVNQSSNTMQVINITNPSTPTVVGTLSTGSLPHSVAVSGNYAYVVNHSSNNLQLIDISNPAAPTVTSTVTTGSNPYFVSISGNHTYVVNRGDNSFQSFILGCPTNYAVTVNSVTGQTTPLPLQWNTNFNNISNANIGNVGIGTTTPSNKLTVAGNADITGNVGIGTASPNASAILDASSTSKGFLMPRMTTAQRDAIASPAVGLQIFNLDNQCVDLYDGSNWIKTCGLKVTGVATDPVHPTPDSWTQIANFGGVARRDAVGFSIDSKGYVGTGWDGNFKNDFWEFDPTTKTWTQKANFGGTARATAVGFSIGSKGYVGMGGDPASKNDFWEYDPTTNTWTQKANFGGTVRNAAVGFSIGNKGYYGTGYYSGLKNDFWEYDPTSDNWTQKTNFGGTARYHAVGFSIGNKGYIGTGLDNDNSSFRNDFWEYDPSSDTWIQKANFGGTGRAYAVGFSIGNDGYIGTGGVGGGSYKNDFWKYDPTTNTWTQKANLGGSVREEAVGFSIDNKGYIGTGWNFGYKNDFWEYMDNNVTGSSYTSNTITSNNLVSDGAWNLYNGTVYNANEGNVGIGTTTPSNKLTVSGNADFTGNVGIGTTTPVANLDVAGAAAFGATNITIGGVTNALEERITLNYACPPSSFCRGRLTAKTNVSLSFGTNGIDDRVIIDNGGNVGIGALPVRKLEVAGEVRATGYNCRSGTSGSYNNNIFNYFWTGSAIQAWIDGTNVGTLQFTSDRRLKENIQPSQNNALSRVMSLKPVSFNYKKLEGTIFTGSDVVTEGFIADELQKIIPSAVNGEKDALTIDGKIQPQSINLAPVVSVLTKAMQEQQVQIENLKAENENLKSDIASIKAHLGIELKAQK